MVESVRVQLQRVESQEYQAEDLLRCILGLNPLEIEIFKAVLDDYQDVLSRGLLDSGDGYRGIPVKKIARKIKKDRTTVQRGVKSLREMKLLSKEQCTPAEYYQNRNPNKVSGNRGGGLLYLYKPAKITSLKERLKDNLDAWYEKMIGFVEHFTEELAG